MPKRAIGLVAGLVAACGSSQDLPVAEVGTWNDIESFVQRLVSADGYAILVIDAGGTEDFIQFSGEGGRVQMDFPLVTTAQQAREAEIRAFFERRQLPLVVNVGSNGARFLDSDLPADPQALSDLTKAAFREVFHVDESAQFRFQGENLAAAS